MALYGFRRKASTSAADVDGGASPLELALRNSPVTVFMQDRELCYTWINNSTLQQAPDSLIGKTDDEIFTPHDAATLRAIKLTVLDTNQGCRHEIRVDDGDHHRYFDLTIEPLRNRAGHTVGITGTAIDITDRHIAENHQRFLTQFTDALRGLDDPDEVMHAAAVALRGHLNLRHISYGEIAHGRHLHIVASCALPAGDRVIAPRVGPFLAQALSENKPLVVDDLDQADPQITPVHAGALRAMGAVAFVAIPLFRADNLAATLIAHHPEPRPWHSSEVTLIQDVAQRTQQAFERAHAQRALRESEARYRLLSRLTSDYAFSYRVKDNGDHEVEWKSGAFERISGYTNDEIQSAADWNKIFHRKDLAHLRRAVERLIDNKPQSFELRIITKAGDTRWLAVDAKPIWNAQLGRVLRVVGAARDITDRKRAEAEQQRLLERLEAEQALIKQVIDQMPVGVMVMEAPSGKLLFSNAQVQQITGYTGDITSQETWQHTDLPFFHPDGTPWPPEDWPIVRALRDGESTTSQEVLFRHPVHDHMATLRGSVAPVRDAAGQIIAAVTIFNDVTEEKRAQRATKLLARAGRILASSLDYETTLRSLAHLTVPELADWCQLDLLTPQGDLQTLASFHADSQRTTLIQELARRYPVSPDVSWGAWAVTRTGEVEWTDDIRDDMVVEIARDDEHLRQLRDAGLRSYISVPLKGRGRIFGVLSFVTDRFGSHRRYTQADVDLAVELARRASMAIDKSLLYRDAQREVAERRATERKLQSLNETLEQRVAERTAEAEHRAAQLRALAAELTQAEQHERRRLAQLLHDHLQQLLVAAKLHLHAVATQFSDEETRLALRQIDELLTQSVDASRSLTTELSPPILHDAGLAAALDWLSRWMRDKHGLHVTVHADPRANPTIEDVRVLLFNATRELLFNIVKHAGTRRAHVKLDRDEQQRVRLTVSDEGVGFDPTTAHHNSNGFGLFSIQQRLEVLGGDTRIHSQPGKGTRIELLAPDTP